MPSVTPIGEWGLVEHVTGLTVSQAEQPKPLEISVDGQMVCGWAPCASSGLHACRAVLSSALGCTLIESQVSGRAFWLPSDLESISDPCAAAAWSGHLPRGTDSTRSGRPPQECWEGPVTGSLRDSGQITPTPRALVSASPSAQSRCYKLVLAHVLTAAGGHGLLRCRVEMDSEAVFCSLGKGALTDEQRLP